MKKVGTRVRLVDIAKIASVSTATVSKVINGKTSELSDKTVSRVQEVISREGYVPNAVARAMITNRTNIIGLVIPDIKNPFFTEMARGAEDVAYELGYSLFLCNSDDDYEKELKYLYSLHEMRSDGIIVAGSFQRDKKSEINHNFNIPMVAIDRQIFYRNVKSFIMIDNYLSSMDLSKKLYDKGYRSFLYLGGPRESSVSIERYKGTASGLDNKEVSNFDSKFGKYTMNFGFESVTDNKDIGKYDMIICGNDLIALGVINALQIKGFKVPEDIGVTGFDDIELSSNLVPNLSTISQPTYEMGAASVRLIDKIINDYDYEESYMFDQKVVLRDSTK